MSKELVKGLLPNLPFGSISDGFSLDHMKWCVTFRDVDLGHPSNPHNEIPRLGALMNQGGDHAPIFQGPHHPVYWVDVRDTGYIGPISSDWSKRLDFMVFVPFSVIGFSHVENVHESSLSHLFHYPFLHPAESFTHNITDLLQRLMCINRFAHLTFGEERVVKGGLR